MSVDTVVVAAVVGSGVVVSGPTDIVAAAVAVDEATELPEIVLHGPGLASIIVSIRGTIRLVFVYSLGFAAFAASSTMGRGEN